MSSLSRKAGTWSSWFSSYEGIHPWRFKSIEFSYFRRHSFFRGGYLIHKVVLLDGIKIPLQQKKASFLWSIHSVLSSGFQWGWMHSFWRYFQHGHSFTRISWVLSWQELGYDSSNSSRWYQQLTCVFPWDQKWFARPFYCCYPTLFTITTHIAAYKLANITTHWWTHYLRWRFLW